MVTLFQFDGMVLLAAFLVIAFAGLVHGTLGLGFPLIATPLLATMMDVRSAILITLLPTLAVNLASIAASENRLSTLRRFTPLILFALLGSVIGTAILAATDPAPFRILLAGLILLYLWNGIRIPTQWLSQYPITSMAFFGLVSGMAAGTTNVMVAILIIYFLSLQTPRSIMVPALNTCFLVGKASQIAVLALAGFVGFSFIIETLPLALTAAIALLLGRRLQARIQVNTYQKILRGLLLVLAIILLVQFAHEIGLTRYG